MQFKNDSKKEDEINLDQFSGSEHYYKSSMFAKGIYHTDGVQYLAEKAKAFWLIDLICSWQTKASVRSQPFQVWKLTVKDQSAVATCEDGNGKKLASQRIEYTDFPKDEITIYVEDGSIDGKTNAKIMMLPSER